VRFFRPRRRPSPPPPRKRPDSRGHEGDPKRHVPRGRLVLLYGVAATLCTLLLGGMAWQQLWRFPEHREAEARQNYRRILTPGPRGNIFDREGRLLVGNRPVFNAVISLNDRAVRAEFRQEYRQRAEELRSMQAHVDRLRLNVESRRAVVQRYLDELNALLGRDDKVDSRELERHFSKSLLLPFTLMSDLAPEEYARLIEQIPVDSSIQVITGSSRFYPYGSAACHVLGYVSNTRELDTADVPGEDLLTFHFEGKVGRSGLERIFDEHLQGRSGGEVWSVDPGGYQYEQIAYRSPEQGNDLLTTLDLDLQQTAERALAGRSGAVVALEIQTGEVLAMASLPGYDLNELSPFISFAVDERIREEGGWLNRATQGLYPPGSTYKIVTAVAGLRVGVIDDHTVIDCPGYFIVGRRTARCHRHSGHGQENLIEAIRDSCNVFFYDRSLAMGIQALVEESERFGLAEATGIELLGETRNMLVPSPAWKARRFYGEGWFSGDTVNMAIGQGYLLVTPLQVASLVASVARSEYRTHPTLVLSRGLREARPATRPIELSPDQMELILEGMRQAGRTGTARLAAHNTGTTVAGKTGTAQVRKDGQPTTLAWFMGFAPADAPTIAIAVLLEGVPEERNIGGGSDAAPVAAAVIRRYIEKQQPIVARQ
jgi:penicillin-binding protein 2